MRELRPADVSNHLAAVQIQSVAQFHQKLFIADNLAAKSLSRIKSFVVVNSAAGTFARKPFKNFFAVDVDLVAATHVHEHVSFNTRREKFFILAHAVAAKTFVALPRFFIAEQVLNFVAVNRARLSALQRQRQYK